MDDESRIRDMLGQLLQVLGCQVTTAEDGLQAVDLYVKARAADQAYDMVILDLTIKDGIGGVQTLKRLREIDPRVKAIIFSGYPDDPVMGNYSRYGFLGALTKPFRREELQVILENNL
jgi:DNA-binding NtrC family response regulator